MKNKLMTILKNNEAEFNRMAMVAVEQSDVWADEHALDAIVNSNLTNDFRAESMHRLIVALPSASLVRHGIGSWIEQEISKINKPSTVDRACKLIQGRANVGQVKYGVSIDRDDLTASEWAQHALEEMLDGAQYLIRLKDEMEALQKENAELKRELSAKSPELSPELSAKSPELTDEISLLKNIIKNGLTIQDYLASKEKELDLIEQLDK